MKKLKAYLSMMAPVTFVIFAFNWTFAIVVGHHPKSKALLLFEHGLTTYKLIILVLLVLILSRYLPIAKETPNQSQPVFICAKLKMKAPGKFVKPVQV